MIRSAISKQSNSISGDEARAVDGKLGPVTDVFFDDSAWTVRYLVVYVEGGLDGYETLITPGAISGADRQAGSLRVETNSERVGQTPRLKANLPVAAQQEVAYYEYLGLAPYWTEDPVAPLPEAAPEGVAGPATGDPHLRSAQEVAGYDIETADDSVGHVEDLLLDDESWKIRYLVVDTRDWLPAKKVLLPLSGISEIEWALEKVSTSVGAQEIKDAPAWDPKAPLDRDSEIRLHEHFGQTPYWVYE